VVQLELDRGEIEVLHRVLNNYLPEFRMTIANTENYEWRQDLKKDEEVIKGLLSRLADLEVRER
jgi:hypothetical protein